MSVRFEHWRSYWQGFTFLSLIIPTLNEYRLALDWGSLHNEPLEIISYFGFLGVLYYGLIIKLLAENRLAYRFLSISILTAIFIGGVFQNNLTNPYLAVFFGLFIFSLGSRKKYNMMMPV